MSELEKSLEGVDFTKFKNSNMADEIKKVLEDNFSKRFVNYLALVFIILVLGFDSCLFFVPIPPANRDIIMTLVGLLNGSGVVTVINFFFGSSSGSKTKDETISSLSK